MDSKLSHIVLRAKIRGLSQAALKSRALISSTTGATRDRHWRTKRAIGAEVRWHILASAFLRGIPYRDVEPHTNSLSNPVIVFRVAEIACQHSKLCITDKQVRTWLQEPARSKASQPAELRSPSIALQETSARTQSILGKAVVWLERALS